ncbi:hypothetical protein CDL12_13987 [Handroanthus impetiginosus]|uniref:Non-specific serine/threonine protein kinase n=1 Tax=Handroanthus impetiginosus TaxID=429701 RepID=A0A2G9H793_9LAMI|nr:hypothetical protein CDL12_19945 [Handroanthus impetiginosus]PIN13386.1 hypothetical protein CDL12_13987 [Handroanthus impetiginosus]
MAASTLPILLLVFLLAATVASARPCKTLFYFSATTTTTYYPYNSLNRNPNPNSIFHRHSPRYLTLIFTTTTTTRFPNHRGALNFFSNNPLEEDSQLTSSDFPVRFYSSVSSSIRDRTRDIISVLGALLFGVGCGVLTGLAVYLVWALFSPRRFDFDDVSSSSSDDDDDDVTVAKKLGYVAIPAEPKLVEDDLKKPAKEVV